MRTRNAALTLAGFTVAALAACSDAAEPVGIGPGLEPDGAVVAGPATATGSGHYFSGGEQRTLAFSAVQNADGSATGEYQIVIHAIDRFLHVSVTCMSARNDTAWIAGIIDRTDHPVIRPGTVSYFWAVDGGEGGGAVDKVSVARINDAVGEDRRFCSLMPDEAFSGLPGNVVVNGNVQVRAR